MNVLIPILHYLLRPYFLFHDFVIQAASKIARRRSHIRDRIPGSDPAPLSKRVAVFVHYDRLGVVHPYVIHQLRELRDAGYRITFVTNAPVFPEQSRNAVAPLCKELLWRHNIGYDFGAYKDGIASIDDLASAEALVLMNDSVYGPFWKLTDTLDAFDPSKADFWGIVDSWELRYHLQTFFLVFAPAALRSEVFRNFWHALPYVNNKRWVVRNGEVKLTQMLARNRLRGAVLAPYWSAAEKMKDRLSKIETGHLTAQDRSALELLHTTILRGYPVNPMHSFWDLLITEFKCPFIKRDLLLSNPAGIPLTSGWSELIELQSAYDVSMITAHLQAMAASPPD
jgi:lipopolysaccharide biosynthesis protein